MKMLHHPGMTNMKLIIQESGPNMSIIIFLFRMRVEMYYK